MTGVDDSIGRWMRGYLKTLMPSKTWKCFQHREEKISHPLQGWRTVAGELFWSITVEVEGRGVVSYSHTLKNHIPLDTTLGFFGRIREQWSISKIQHGFRPGFILFSGFGKILCDGARLRKEFTSLKAKAADMSNKLKSGVFVKRAWIICKGSQNSFINPMLQAGILTWNRNPVGASLSSRLTTVFAAQTLEGLRISTFKMYSVNDGFAHQPLGENRSELQQISKKLQKTPPNVLCFLGAESVYISHTHIIAPESLHTLPNRWRNSRIVYHGKTFAWPVVPVLIYITAYFPIAYFPN